MRPSASDTAVGDPGLLSPYWRFHQAVAEAQLASWLPRAGRLLVDISGPHVRSAQIAAAAGHTVVRVDGVAPRPIGPVDGVPAGLVPPPPEAHLNGAAAPQLLGAPVNGHGPAPAPETKPGQVDWVSADPASLSFLADGCADGIIAEDRTLSMQLATETLIADITRVLRPAGRVLACVDSLVLGMAMLAEQRHWAELTDLPHAEVVLVPWPDGTITRCFGAEQLRELFNDAGLTVMWIRPRTVFSPSTVAHVLNRDPKGLPRLVEAELAIRPDESVGVQLIISARKQGPRRPR
ncbi:MAG TPA: methyltransferase [Streptosporangiaceae bacterium]|nr:methyltransferase [Streptosporangiaceae bacterium]